MDDLFDFGLTPTESSAVESIAVPDSAVQHPSRRAAREAASKRSAPSRSRERSRPATRKLRRAEVASMRASAPKPPRKHPVSVLVTMVAVGGMFVVAGLPAYALSTTSTTLAADTTPIGSQSMAVNPQSAQIAPIRDGYRATTPAQLAEMSKDAVRADNNAAYLASGARELGDDYPWPYELSTYQGGGLSPLNYFYRECVDFVAWRLNRDAGYYAEPYKWVWSTLTPTGGNAYQWKYAWEQHGWTVSDVPVVGSVAWFGTNHVSYVKAVLDGGFVLVEEYNFNPGVYGQRTLAISDVGAFLYPPPA